MKKYTVKFINDLNPQSFVVIGTAKSLDEAAALRKVSGDLVFDDSTDQVETSGKWLWDWEIADKGSYSMKAVSKSCKAQNLPTLHLDI